MGLLGNHGFGKARCATNAGAKLAQSRAESGEVVLSGSGNHIDIPGRPGGTIKATGHAADQDVVHPMPIQNFSDPLQIRWLLLVAHLAGGP